MDTNESITTGNNRASEFTNASIVQARNSSQDQPRYESCDDGLFKTYHRGLCATFSDSLECCQNYRVLGYCETRFNPGGSLDGYCSQSCGFCEGVGDTDLEGMGRGVRYDAAKSNPRLFCLIAFAIIFVAAGCMLLAWGIFVAKKKTTREPKMLAWLKLRQVSRGFIRLAFFISAFLLFLIAGTGVSVFDFSSPDIFVSPVSITRFSVETTIARTVISVEYSLYMKIEEVFMHVAAELQNIEINVYYNHHGAKRSIGFTKIPTTTIETGEISYVGGVLIAPITLDPAWASWFLEDLDAGILQLQIGPEDLVMDLYTRDSIFQWVSGINQQQIAYSYGCRVALYTRPREAVLSSPTAAPSSTHSISRTNESASAVSVGSTSQPVESYLSKTIAGVAHAATGGRIGYDPIQEELTNILGHGYDQECSPLPDQSIDMSRISVVANGCLFVACLAGLASCIQLVILRRLYRRTFDCIDVKNCDRIDAEKILGCVELSVLDESSVFHDLGASHVELH